MSLIYAIACTLFLFSSSFLFLILPSFLSLFCCFYNNRRVIAQPLHFTLNPVHATLGSFFFFCCVLYYLFAPSRSEKHFSFLLLISFYPPFIRFALRHTHLHTNTLFWLISCVCHRTQRVQKMQS